MRQWRKSNRKRREPDWSGDGKERPKIKPHTRVKHQLLESYLKDWVETITGNCKFGTGQVTLIDGFCGGGIYQDGNTLWEGSPLRMIRAVESGWQAVKQRKPYQNLDIAYLFIDAQRDHTNCLKLQIREAGFGHLLDTGKCRVITGDVEEHLQECLEWVRQRGGYSFFFLDPYGLADLPNMSRAILSLGKSEVLLNHMQQDGLMRHIGRYQKDGTLMSFLERHELENHYGWCADIESLPTLQQQTRLHDSALRLFREKSQPRFAWTFAFMQNPNTVYYYLVHLSNNPTAVSVMRRVLWNYNNLDYQFHYGVFGLGYRTLDDLDQNLQLLDIHQRNSVECEDKLKGQLDRFIHERKTLSFGQLFEGSLEQHPATREICMSVAHQMVADGEWEMLRDGKSCCISRINNADLIQRPSAKQIILLAGGKQGRILQKKKGQTGRKRNQISACAPGQLPIIDIE